MSAGSNLSGLAPLGSKKIPLRHIIPETANEMSDFDLVPDKSSRGQEMLSPLAMKNRPQPQQASSNSSNPLLKASFGRGPNPNKGIGLAPLGAKNLNNDFNANNANSDPLLRSLKQKKQGLAPMGIAQINMGSDHEETYQSPIKCRIGANRIISPMGSKHSELPMHVLGVSRTNLSYTLRQPKGVPAPLPVNGKQLLNIDGAFPDDDSDDDNNVNGVGSVNLQRTLRDTNRLMGTGHRMKNMIAPVMPEGNGHSGGQLSQNLADQSMRRSRRRPEAEHDPWSTTTGSSYIY